MSAADEAAAARPRRIVLIGAGHAHLQVIEAWRKRPIPGVELLLLTAFDRAAYSGLIPAVLAGQAALADAVIDLPAFCESAGVTLFVDRATGLDPLNRRIVCAHHPAVEYDVAAINIGSVPRHEHLCQTHRMLVSVKPLTTLIDRLERRLAEWRSQRLADTADPLRVAVIGGGAGGVELALGLAAKFRREGPPARLELITATRRPLEDRPPAVQRLVGQVLLRHGVSLEAGTRIVGCDEDGPGALIVDDGRRLPCDLAIWVTGAAPPPFLARAGLPLAESGFLAVRETLQVEGHDDLFATGDVAELPTSVPKAGVYAVRQGPILWENLRRWFTGEPPVPYPPQSDFLSLLNCGDGTAILDYRGWALRGRWIRWWKDRIDRRFVARFR